MATDADTKVENENASASAVDYTAYPPPPAPREKPTVEADELPPAQAEMHGKVLEHFRSESYRLPGVKEDEDGELRDEEKFWLVRFFFLVSCWLMIGVLSLCFFVRSLMIACCGKEVYLSLKLALESSELDTATLSTRVQFANTFFWEFDLKKQGICVLRNGFRQRWPSRGWRVRSSGGVNMASTNSRRN